MLQQLSSFNFRRHSSNRFGLKIALLALCFTIAACGNNRMLRPHKISIQQGNLITQEMVNRLKPGMSKRQVEFVLGTPLIADTLSSDQWHYVYTLRTSNGKALQKNLNVLFVNDELSELTGDYKPETEE